VVPWAAADSDPCPLSSGEVGPALKILGQQVWQPCDPTD